MSCPLISVVTCTYNKFETIFYTIDSVLQQDYPYMEYIITDDGSLSFPYEAVCTHIEKNKRENLVDYKIIRNSSNLGTVRNLNGAFKQAKGKYILVLSGDDAYNSNHVLSEIVTRMLNNDSNVLVTSRIACDCNFKPQYVLPHYIFRKRLLKMNTARKQHGLFIGGHYFDMASGSAMSYKKDFLEKEGYFDEKYLLWEDGPFLERYLRNNCIDMAYDIISIKYQLGGISTSDKIPDKLMADLLLFNSTDRIESIDFSTKFYKKLVLFHAKYSSKKLSIVNKLEMIILHPHIVIYKVYYKYILYRLAELYDRRIYIPKVIKQLEDKLCK